MITKLALIAAFLILTSCKSEVKVWEKTKNQNTIESYKSYLNEYPEGKFADAATKEIVALNWKLADSLDSYDAILKFINDFPGTIFEKDALKKLRSYIDPLPIQAKQTDKVSEEPMPNNLEVIATKSEQEFLEGLQPEGSLLSLRTLTNSKLPAEDCIFVIVKWQMVSSKEKRVPCRILIVASGEQIEGYSKGSFGYWWYGAESFLLKENKTYEKEWLFVIRKDQLDEALLNILGWEFKLHDNFDPRESN